MASIEKRGEYSYRITVSTGYDSDGIKQFKKKTITLEPGLTPKQTEKELLRLAVEFEAEVERGTYLDGSKITFAQFADRWISDYAEKELAPKTVHGYKYLLTRILPAIGHIKLQKLQPVHLMDFYDNLRELSKDDTKYLARPEFGATLKEKGANDKTLASSAKLNARTIRGILAGSPTTLCVVKAICGVLDAEVDKLFIPKNDPKPLSDESIKHYHRLISSILTSAVQWQIILANPAARVKPPKAEKKEAAHYNEDQTERMLTLLEQEPIKYRTMIYIAVYSGCRLGELAGLEWCDIDTDNNLLRIRQASQYLPGKGIFTKTTKNETSQRIISIPPVLSAAIKKYKVWQDQERLKCGELWNDTNDWVFTQWNGLPIHPSTPSKWFKQFRDKHQLPALKFHGLRHTNATLLIGQGVDTQTVAGRLGHKDSTTTQRIYSHFLHRPDKEAAKKLENLFSKKKTAAKKKA